MVIVETHIEKKGEDLLTRVRWFINRSEKEIYTELLTPHGDCKCADSRHPKNIKFKVNRRETSNGIHEIDLYLWCDPNVPVESYVEESDIRCTRKTTIHYKTGTEKWQYICTYFIEENRTNYNILLKLKTTKTLIDAVKIFSSELAACDDMKQLLTDGTYSDITLLSKEGIPFKVHKAILAKRSEVFRGMFEYDQKTEINTTFYEDVLEEMLTYIYTGRSPNVASWVADLLYAADYYQLPGLKIICADELHRQLTVDNAITTLELADRYSCTDLQDLTFKFITDGSTHLVIKTEGWKNIESLNLVRKLYEELAKASVEEPDNCIPYNPDDSEEE